MTKGQTFCIIVDSVLICVVMGRGVIMLFELKSVFLNEGLEQQLSYELDISEIDMDGVFPFTSPVAVTAIARNRAGLVTLTLQCSYDYTRSCDRCGEPFTRRENKTFVHDLAQTLVDEGNDDYIETPDQIKARKTPKQEKLRNALLKAIE